MWFDGVVRMFDGSVFDVDDTGVYMFDCDVAFRMALSSATILLVVKLALAASEPPANMILWLTF